MIRLMIVEDNAVVRRGLVKFFLREEGINVVAEAIDATSAISLLREGTDVDILMADWNMPDMNGLDLTAKLTDQFSDVKTVILTMHGKQEYRDKARAAGARGYILKGGDFDELVEAIRRVAVGEEVFI